MTTTNFDFTDLAALFHGPAIRERLWSKTCQDLHEYFINCAVTAPAWPLSSTRPERATAGWLLPGEYTLAELQDRFAPRYKDVNHLPDPDFQVIAAKTIEAVSGMLRAVLLMPEHAALVAEALARGLNFSALHQLAFAEVGGPLCSELVAEIGLARVGIAPDYLRDAGERRLLNEVILAQERQHRQRTAHASKERYEQLLKRWQTSSGDLHSVHIATGSELADDLIDWLQTLDAVDASVFLANHNRSAWTAAQYGMSPALFESIVSAEMTLVPPPYPKFYARLRSLLTTLLSITGYRRITLTSPDGSFSRVDLDQFNRVGTDETHVGYLVNMLLTALMSRGGIMIRAYQADTLNVFIPEKGGFAKVGVKHMYGALLEHGQVVGLSARQVSSAMTKNSETGGEVARESSVRCFDWPSGPRWSSAGNPGIAEA